MGVVKGAISIKDNATVVLRSIRKEQSAFRQDVIKTQVEMQRTWDTRRTARLETASATKKMNELKRKLEPFRKKVVTAVAIKDMVTSKLKTVTSKVKSLGKMVATPIIKIKDAATAGIKKISSGLKKIAKSVVIPVAIAGAVGTAALGGAVSSGMQLEQQQVSMTHFIGATNKGMDSKTVDKTANEYISALRDNANKTPFETGDVISAGSRAIAIANGNTKEAMELVKLSEDMAAASGGTKSISDAIEALADAKVGETERLKEFGFKVSAEDMKKKGFSGVSAELGDFYGGASEKLAGTGAGLLSTIKGKLKSNFSDFGLQIVDKLKPAFDSIIGLVDKITPIMAKFGGQIADNIGKGISMVSAAIPQLISGLSTFKPLFDTASSAIQTVAPHLATFRTAVGESMGAVATSVIPVISTIVQTISTVLPAILPVLQTIITTISTVITAAMPIISGLVQGIGTVVQTLAPIFNTIFSGIADKVGVVIDFVASKMGFIGEIFNTVAPLIGDILSTAWTVISPIMDIMINVFKVVFSVVQAVFPGIQKVIQTVWNIIKPVVEVIGTVLGGIGDAIGWVANALTGGGSKEVAPDTKSAAIQKVASDKGLPKNATGTNNWRGGVTWVGEKGAELIDLPRGTRILPHKESVRFATQSAASRGFGVPQAASRAQSAVEKVKQTITITIAKLADSIVVREEADIDKIETDISGKIIEAIKNFA